MTARKLRPQTGSAKPRIAPPVPARSDLPGFRKTAEAMGIVLMPWQETAGRYLTAIGPDGLLLYREVCIVVGRQNGKTTLMKPLIIRALRSGKKVMHIAQNRELPRIMFGVIADALSEEPELFPKRRGRTIWPRYGSGQEEIALQNGGVYRIAAASRGGARGHPNDLVIIDELREMETFEVVGAAEPTLTMSSDPQMIYLSNAGHDNSVVLNAVRDRAGKDDSLAYLEWSAAPERAADDREGWLEANPAIGHYPQVLREVERSYNSNRLAGTLSLFETERLCRWVATMRERLVDEFDWTMCEADELEAPRRPAMGVSMDPQGHRASAALAWQQTDGTLALRVLLDVTGTPIDTDDFGAQVRDLATRYAVKQVGFDPLTDAELAKFTKAADAIGGAKYANATARFATAIKGHRLRWHDAVAVGDDLTWTARKPHDETGHYEAVRASDERPITAVLAAIRAVYWASGPKPARLRVC